ncbi:hypothetical protein MC885_012849 [Smutsia gigantea]|nr:hypothetical protein MC885_012849 [Smutsia gigantea]
MPGLSSMPGLSMVFSIVTMFSPKTNIKNDGKRSSKCKNSYKCREFPLEHSLPTKLSRQLAVACGRAAVRCVQYSGDGRRLACGLANHLALVFNADLTGTPAVFPDKNGTEPRLDWGRNDEAPWGPYKQCRQATAARRQAPRAGARAPVVVRAVV